MEQNDFFARIAMEHHPVGKDELVESKPLNFYKKLFTPSTSICPAILEKSYDEMLVDYKVELANLKARYKPFMSDFTPAARVTRKSRELEQFQFRYACDSDIQDINYTIKGNGSWEMVTLPDYRGPVGKWTGYYRTVFNYDKTDKKVFLRFLGVDYIADVYLNSRHIGFHEGFFASFEFDITSFLKYDAENILLVEVRNDIPTTGLSGSRRNGDKIYAATGLGWDDPKDGWHHCPPGAGIYNSVLLEERSEVFIESVFVRPDIDNSSVEVRAQVYNATDELKDIKMDISLYPFNFEKAGISDISVESLEPADSGINYYRFTCALPNFRLWQPEEPWLYTARLNLKGGNEGLLDQKDSVFGMRKFHMDETGEEKGSLYLNNKPVILRGANDMGHMQQCVIRKDMDQLVEDILIAKLANMNFYRFTQRPVQEEIYRYCDMLGMMNQTDLPLFAYLRRNQFCEAVRQAGEMERLIRNHPSSIMITYINEPFPVGAHKLGHRNLYRDELEAFFAAANNVVRVENPDRVIKHVEGDYDPPTLSGLSDFHCYNMWYTNHALPVGDMYKGYLPATKRGWKTGCGEYGTEGLDNYNVMQKYYPEDWLPADEATEWRPDVIIYSQSNSMHGDWYEEQNNIMDWIRESQKHQAFATWLMTDALRRRSDKVVSTAIHLLIDAWPAGWMKALVDVDRIPKPAYFAFKKSLKPVRINLRCDRWKVYEADEIEIEAWLLNDTPSGIAGVKAVAVLRDNERVYGSYEICCAAQPVSSKYAGSIRVKIPEVTGRKMYYLDTVLLDTKGIPLDCERFQLEAFERPVKDKETKVSYIGDKAYSLAFSLGMDTHQYNNHTMDYDVLVISDPVGYEREKQAIAEAVKKGTRAIFLTPEDGKGEWVFNEKRITYKKIYKESDTDNIINEEGKGIYFVAANMGNRELQNFRAGDFSYWYNSEKEKIDFTALNYIDSDEIEPLLFSYKKPSFFNKTMGAKERLPVAAEINQGAGSVTFLSLCLDGRVGCNPTLDEFLRIVFQ